MDKIQGTRPVLIVVDEHTSLKGVDFSKLEHLLATDGWGMLRTRHDPNNDTYDIEVYGRADAMLDDGSLVDYKLTGISRHQNPQLNQIPRGTVTGRIRSDQPEFQELPGVRELHAKAWGELLHTAFESPAARQAFKELSFLERYSSPGPKIFKDHFTMKPYGADHPSRNREPKGPRKKWGKL